MAWVCGLMALIVNNWILCISPAPDLQIRYEQQLAAPKQRHASGVIENIDLHYPMNRTRSDSDRAQSYSPVVEGIDRSQKCPIIPHSTPPG